MVTRDASPDAGAAPACRDNIRRGFDELIRVGKTAAGRQSLARLFSLCSTSFDINDLYIFLLFAFDNMAMGNFPYPSNYLTPKPDILMPTFPWRVACGGALATPSLSGEALLTALGQGASVYTNASKQESCYSLQAVHDDPEQDGLWDYLFCTEMMPQETYFSRDGVNDMFLPFHPDEAYNMSYIHKRCREKWGVEPNPTRVADWLGGMEALKQASNIVLSNGLYDPWSAIGVLSSVSETVVAVIIPEGAHHLDLMFAHPDDPLSVREARHVELQHIKRWLGLSGALPTPMLAQELERGTSIASASAAVPLITAQADSARMHLSAPRLSTRPGPSSSSSSWRPPRWPSPFCSAPAEDTNGRRRSSLMGRARQRMRTRPWKVKRPRHSSLTLLTGEIQ